MDKDYIISEIKRTALENGGVSIGQEKFEKLTGIKRHTWYGIHWRSWNEAVQEAGLTGNKFGSDAYGETDLLEKLAELTLSLGKFPANVDIKLARKNDPTFPAPQTFNNKLGSQAQRVFLLRKYAIEHKPFANILELLPDIEVNEEPNNAGMNLKTKEGFVYLGMLKIDTKKRYKIGKTNLVERRNAELSLQLPEKLELVHYIKTDDMGGIETYWHKRFADKNTNGEWFDLSNDEVRMFKLRKFM
ncbi:MAG: GIY-YIG nuclease family protein [Alphaproteobacteria bacterium]